MERIGRYRIINRIGAGSFATVWQGHDDDLDVPVAVKVLAENWATRDDVRQRFLAEARLMRRISDRRVIRVYDIGALDDTRPYFVMDYCDAGSLEQWRRELRPPTDALRVAAQAARAIQVLHDHHVVHRDVTPGNLLLDSNPDGSVVVRLADLGVAKSMLDDVAKTLTAGTPSYMSREQAVGARFDHRADIYSVGCVTYALLTGRPPFRVRNLSDLLTREPDDRPAPLAGRLSMPPELDVVLHRALALDAAGRPDSANDLAEQLDRVVAQAEAGATRLASTRIVSPGVRFAASGERSGNGAKADSRDDAGPGSGSGASAGSGGSAGSGTAAGSPGSADVPPHRHRITHAEPGQVAARQVTPGQAVPGQVAPAQAVPGQNVPGQNMPGQAVPGQTAPADPVQRRPQRTSWGEDRRPVARPVAARPDPITLRDRVEPAPPVHLPMQAPHAGQMVNDWSYLPVAEPPPEDRSRHRLNWILLAILGFLLAIIATWIYVTFIA